MVLVPLPYSEVIAAGDPQAVQRIQARMKAPVFGLMLITATDGSAPALFHAAATVAGPNAGTRWVIWVQDPASVEAFLAGLTDGPASMAGVEAIAYDCTADRVADVVTDVPNGLENMSMDASFRTAGA